MYNLRRLIATFQIIRLEYFHYKYRLKTNTMNTTMYHLTFITLCCVLMFSEWYCLGILTIAWVFQLAHLVCTCATLKKPRYNGVQDRIKREYYHKSGVSILKPLMGCTDTLEENLETYFTLDYPVYEIIFCVETKEDPAVAVIKKLQAKYTDVCTIISDGLEDIGINPKLNNMITGYRVAQYDLVWVADANIVASDAALQDMVDRCVDGCRLVHQIPWGISGPMVSPTLGAMSCGSILERWYFATSHARPYMVVNNSICTCLNGMSNLISKPHLDKIGGLERFANILNEDGEIGVAFDQYGYETAICKHVAIQNFGTFDICDYINRRVRWMRLRNKFAKISSFTPLELIIDNHLCGLLCVVMLSYWHESISTMFILYHLVGWLLVDSLVFMCMDAAVALPNSWQDNIFDWGRVSNRPRGTYYFCFNVLEHYIMWMTRECIGVYIRLKALQKTSQVTWKDNQFNLDQESPKDK